ncbi:hypothetical protein HT136_07325 [Novosphingobium profundi]|uniref:hypothetical protein n=1 Tax=Novosphingobium profundi TaxID=1774954 RepID=UPI001BD9D43A|nr:hypothetical protein [Novosphingobium profundi]MBT0668174.1 hypothetical protein [Novosphingobium profundi]
MDNLSKFRARTVPRLALACTLGASIALATPLRAEEDKASEPSSEQAAERGKAAEDPTKIATKAGVSYSDELSASGSVAVGPKFKFNGRIAKSGQWSAGASYLFPVAILTLTAGRSELDTGVKQTRLSVGGFVPLSQLGLKTGRWQFFAPFGYSHTKSEQAVTDLDMQDGIPVSISSDSVYVGLFTIRPLSTRLTLLAGANYTRGSHDYSGIAAAGGLSYHLTGRDTVSVRGSYVHNSFGQKQRIGIAYQHEF